MNEEYLFEVAKERGWDKILEIALRDKSFDNIASEVNKTEEDFKKDLWMMEDFGLIYVKVRRGRRYYFITALGLKLIQKDAPK